MAGLNDDLPVKVSTSKLQDMGVKNRQAAYLALAGLEREGLIFIERRAGANPLVTLNRHPMVSETATATCPDS